MDFRTFDVEDYNNTLENVKNIFEKEFLGKILQHKTLGYIKFIDVNYDNSNFGGSKVIVASLDDDGGKKILGMGMLPKVVKCSEEFIDKLNHIENLTTLYRSYRTELATRKSKIKANAKKLKVDPKDEEYRVVTEDEWKAAMEVADEPRVYGESRVVIRDDQKMYINASAALRDIYEYTRDDKRSGKRDVSKDGDKIYQACETNGKYKGSKWRYAEPEEIEFYIQNTFR